MADLRTIHGLRPELYTIRLGRAYMQARTIEQARSYFLEYRDQLEAEGKGSHSLKKYDGRITIAGEHLADVSYNGRVWSTDGTEIILGETK